jgi:hypothetical protein
MKIAIVPSHKTPHYEYNRSALAVMTLAKIAASDVEEVRILGDNAPLAKAWANEPSRAPKVVIETVWPREGNSVRSANDAAKTRNEALLDGVATVMVFGRIATRSAQATMARVFGSPRFKVFQVIDGTASQVGSETIACEPGFEIKASKPERTVEASYTDPFMPQQAAPKAKAKK